MKPFFIKCSVERIDYRTKALENIPVNISICKSICKRKFAWYPDNTGKPSIRFNGCGVEWVYNSEAERDLEFDKISNNRIIEL